MTSLNEKLYKLINSWKDLTVSLSKPISFCNGRALYYGKYLNSKKKLRRPIKLEIIDLIVKNRNNLDENILEFINKNSRYTNNMYTKINDVLYHFNYRIDKYDEFNDINNLLNLLKSN